MYIAYGLFTLSVGIAIGIFVEKQRVKTIIGNKNDFAVYISRIEGLKKSLSIAQIKEVLRIVLGTLGI